MLLLLLLAILVRDVDERRYVVHGTRYYGLDSASKEKRTIPLRIDSYYSVIVVGEVSWRLDRVWSKSRVVSQTEYLHLIVAAFFCDALVLRGRKNGRIGTCYGAIKSETVSKSRFMQRTNNRKRPFGFLL